MVLGDLGEVRLLGKVLTDQTVGVFIQAALPTGIRVSEIDIGIKLGGNPLVMTKLTAVVYGDGVDLVLTRQEQIDTISLYLRGPLSLKFSQQRELRFALSATENSAFVLRPNDRVSFPVAEA